MNLINFLVIIFTLIDFFSFEIVQNKWKCPKDIFCDCNWNTKRIECSCKSKECKNVYLLEPAKITFSNQSFLNFDEIYISNIERLNRDFFKNSFYSNKFKLSIQSVKIFEKNFLSCLNGIQNLEIIYHDLIQIEQKSFDYLDCETFSFISLGKNYALNLNSFGDGTDIKILSLDYHSSNYLTTLFINDSPEWKYFLTHINFLNYLNLSLTKTQLNKFWSSSATIRHIYIQEAKGIKTLDHTFVPKFKRLEKIEIYHSDINQISFNFALLHSNSLKYLTISESSLEIIHSVIFEKLVKLEFLDLSSNPIKIFGLESFKGLESLQVLVLKSISDTYVLDNSDICMLSYLPCNVDVYLDNYDDYSISCALIYLYELKNDTSKFRSTINSNILKNLPTNIINYKRDVECKLSEQLKFCLEITHRNSHCLSKSFNIDKDSNEISFRSLLNISDEDDSKKICISFVDKLLRKNKLINVKNDFSKSLNQVTHKAVKLSNSISNTIRSSKMILNSTKLIKKSTQKSTANQIEISKTTFTTNKKSKIKLNNISILVANNTIDDLTNLNKSVDILPTSIRIKKFYDEWLYLIVIISLIIFCFVQIIIGAFIINSFYAKRCKKIGCFKQTKDCSNQTISIIQENNEEINYSNENIRNLNIEEYAPNNIQRVISKKPKFAPRPPIQFLRQSPYNSKNFDF